MDKLEQLAALESMGTMKLLEESIFDSLVRGICNNAGCDYTTEVEPDCATGYCEVCQTNTVRSCLVLAGVI